MTDWSRWFRKKVRQLTNAKTISLDGVTLISDKSRIPTYLRDLMFREGYENTERNILLKILKPGSRVVELGTGVGFIALLATKISGSGNVVTYEANPKVEGLIRDNFALNQEKPELRMVAVTRDGRRINFKSADNIISSSAMERDVTGTTAEIESIAIDTVLSTHRPDVLIMDVEGAEYELLTIDEFYTVQHILVELHPHIIGDAKVDEIKAHLKGKGFLIGANDRKATHFYLANQV